MTSKLGRYLYAFWSARPVLLSAASIPDIYILKRILVSVNNVTLCIISIRENSNDILSRDAVAARRQVLEKKILILKSAATSSLHEYTAREIIDSGISWIKRQIAFMAMYRLSLCIEVRYNHSNATSFESIGWDCAKISVCSAKNSTI